MEGDILMHIELLLKLAKLKKNVEKLANYISNQYSQNSKGWEVMDSCKTPLIVMEVQIRICKL